MIEQLIALLAPYPYLEEWSVYEWNDQYQTTITYKVNDLLVAFSVCRIYLLLRFLLVRSLYMNPRSKRVCTVNGCSANILFASKAIVRERPLQIIFVATGLTILLFGY